MIEQNPGEQVAEQRKNTLAFFHERLDKLIKRAHKEAPAGSDQWITSTGIFDDAKSVDFMSRKENVELINDEKTTLGDNFIARWSDEVDGIELQSKQDG